MPDRGIRHHLHWPHVPPRREVFRELGDTLSGRWLGEGPKVREFERRYARLLDAREAVAVSSGSAALHLAYELADLCGKRVLAPLFTCTATNHMLLQAGADLEFYDVSRDDMNPCPDAAFTAARRGPRVGRSSPSTSTAGPATSRGSCGSGASGTAPSSLTPRRRSGPSTAGTPWTTRSTAGSPPATPCRPSRS